MPKFLLALAFLFTAACSTDTVTVKKNSAWARATPPGVTTTAIYLTLINHKHGDINLVSAASDLTDRFELHTHLSQDGMMKMQQVEAISVAAHSTTELKPHGNHIMVFNLTEKLIEGDVVEVKLGFDDDTELSISVPVLKVAPPSDTQHTNHDKQKKHDKHKNH